MTHTYLNALNARRPPRSTGISGSPPFPGVVVPPPQTQSTSEVLPMNYRSCLKILALALVLAAPPAQAGLVHRYSFDDTVSTTNALDTVGGANGTNFGGVTITGGQAVFNGVAGSYIQLPNDLVLPDTNLTMEIWVTDTAQATWTPLYD